MDDDDLRDLFDSLPSVRIKRLFGGRGIWAEGVIVGLVTRGELYLKADEQTAPRFRDAGCTQWRYSKRADAKTVAMPYWSVPDAALDDRDAMAHWVRLAYEAGRRSRS